jgi:hypothetical protein
MGITVHAHTMQAHLATMRQWLAERPRIGKNPVVMLGHGPARIGVADNLDELYRAENDLGFEEAGIESQLATDFGIYSFTRVNRERPPILGRPGPILDVLAELEDGSGPVSMKSEAGYFHRADLEERVSSGKSSLCVNSIAQPFTSATSVIALGVTVPFD